MPETPEPARLTPRRPRQQASPLARIGLVVFVIGLVGVAVIMVAFATGSQELPLWLNLVAMLAPVGFGIGLVGIYRESRAARRRSVARNAAAAGVNGGLR